MQPDGQGRKEREAKIKSRAKEQNMEDLFQATTRAAQEPQENEDDEVSSSDEDSESDDEDEDEEEEAAQPDSPTQEEAVQPDIPTQEEVLLENLLQGKNLNRQTLIVIE